MQKIKDALVKGTLRIIKKLISPSIETDNLEVSNEINGVSINDYIINSKIPEIMSDYGIENRDYLNDRYAVLNDDKKTLNENQLVFISNSQLNTLWNISDDDIVDDDNDNNDNSYVPTTPELEEISQQVYEMESQVTALSDSIETINSDIEKLDDEKVDKNDTIDNDMIDSVIEWGIYKTNN